MGKFGFYEEKLGVAIPAVPDYEDPTPGATIKYEPQMSSDVQQNKKKTSGPNKSTMTTVPSQTPTVPSQTAPSAISAAPVSSTPPSKTLNVPAVTEQANGQQATSSVTQRSDESMSGTGGIPMPAGSTQGEAVIQVFYFVLCYLISRVIDGKTINPETSVVFLAPHYLRRLVDSGLTDHSHSNSPALFEAMFQWFMLSLNFASIWLDEERLHTMTMTSWMRVDLKTYRTMERRAYIALEHNLALLAADWDRWLDKLNNHLGSNIFRNLNIAILYDLLERSRTKHAFWQIPAHRPLSDPVASSVFLDGAYCTCAAVGSYSQCSLPTDGASIYIADSAHMRPLESIHVSHVPVTSYSCPVHSSEYRVYVAGTPAASYDTLNGSVGTLSSVALSDSYMASGSNQEPSQPESSAREEDIVTQRPYSSLFSDNIQSITSAPVSPDSLSSSCVHDGRSHQNVQEGFGKAESYMDFEDTETESDCDTCYSESDIGEQSLPVPVPTGVGGGGLSPLLSRRPLPKGLPVEDNRILLSVDPALQSSSRLMDIPESRSNHLPLRLPYSSSQSYLASTSEAQVSRQQAVGELEPPISDQVCTGGFQQQQLLLLGPRPMVSGVFHPFIRRKLKIAS
ncbi:hypothetical protein VKT23_012144 [Stygiomarasmius scandens]|uniref:Uncharacterized protein n=1 Tax=Marasmiellus scandens TaxID=2682957 RepID=A0ABR1J7T8_9AGAR